MIPPPTPTHPPKHTHTVGVIAYLKQLLDTGVFHADPHPGNLIRTPDGRLAILDFGGWAGGCEGSLPPLKGGQGGPSAFAPVRLNARAYASV